MPPLHSNTAVSMSSCIVRRATLRDDSVTASGTTSIPTHRYREVRSLHTAGIRPPLPSPFRVSISRSGNQPISQILHKVPVAATLSYHLTVTSTEPQYNLNPHGPLTAQYFAPAPASFLPAACSLDQLSHNFCFTPCYPTMATMMTARPSVSSPLADQNQTSGPGTTRITPQRTYSFASSRGLHPFPSISSATTPETSSAATSGKKPLKMIQPPANQPSSFVLDLSQAEFSRQKL
ncbi:hypothetical protein C8R43DRAFT_631496 [Mycena crocata]|nr:hypothetical protein C8R43DRAFT_631496 [Mycena crocata]